MGRGHHAVVVTVAWSLDTEENQGFLSKLKKGGGHRSWIIAATQTYWGCNLLSYRLPEHGPKH